jgi:hypothetical protein
MPTVLAEHIASVLSQQCLLHFNRSICTLMRLAAGFETR